MSRAVARHAAAPKPHCSNDQIERAIWGVILSVPDAGHLVSELDACQPFQNLKNAVSVLRQTPPANLAATMHDALYGEYEANPKNDDAQVIVDELYFFKHGSNITLFDDYEHRDRIEELPNRLAAWFPRSALVESFKARVAIKRFHDDASIHDSDLLEALAAFRRCLALDPRELECKEGIDATRKDYERRYCSTVNVLPAVHVRLAYDNPQPFTEVRARTFRGNTFYLDTTDVVTQGMISRLTERLDHGVEFEVDTRRWPMSLLVRSRPRADRAVLMRGTELLDVQDQSYPEQGTRFETSLETVCASISLPKL
jgi:hypothetical protein